MWMKHFLKPCRHTLPNNAGHYTRTQRACAGLYEGVGLLDDRIHYNTAALSADGLGGQIATINHHLSVDLQVTCDSLRGAVGLYCTQFLSDSLYSPLTGSLAPAFVSLSRQHCFFICSWPDALSSSQSGKRPGCLSFGVSEVIDFVLNEASVLLSQGSNRSVCYYHSSVSLPRWAWRMHNCHHLNSKLVIRKFVIFVSVSSNSLVNSSILKQVRSVYIFSFYNVLFC